MIHVHITTNEIKESKPGANLYQQGYKKVIKKKERACYVCGKKDCIAPTCPRRWDPREKWSNPEKYKQYPGGPNTGTTLNQIGSNKNNNNNNNNNNNDSIPLQLTLLNQQGSTGTQMIQVPRGTQLMQMETSDGKKVLIPYIGGENLSQRGTIQTTNIGGTRPFVRGKQLGQFGIPTSRSNQVEIQHFNARDDPFELFNKMILDTGASHTTVCTPKMVHNIRPAVYPLDMATNVGE